MGQFRLFRVDMRSGLRTAWRAVFLVATALLLATTICPASAFADTHVSGIVNANTTWTAAQSPYVIDTEVQVAYGVTLTIDPGVEVRGGTMTIWGQLAVEGTADRPVYINGVDIAPGPNTSDTLYEISLSHAIVDCRSGGSLYTSTGHAVHGCVIVRDSVVVGAPFIYVWYPHSDCYFERNVFRECGGISTGSGAEGAGDVYVRNNVFYAESQPVSNWASYGTTKTVVEFNTFAQPPADSNQIALRLDPGYLDSDVEIDGRNNYWGTTDASLIPARIYDRADDLSCAGYIPFTPFLTAPDVATPALDLQAPTITAPGLAEGSWYSVATLPAAVVTDADLFRLSYSLDGGSWTPGSSVSEGSHTLVSTALDYALNVSTKTLHLGVDRTAPTTSTVPPATVPSTLTLAVSDNANGSGVSQTYYCLDGGAVTQGTKVSLITAGLHSIEFWSTDVAGNEESPHKVQAFTLTLAKPSLSKLSPTAAKRGSTVTLTGKSFGSRRGTAYVKFGTTKVTKYVSWSATRIKCKVPARAKSGRVKVTVVTAGGTSRVRTFTVKR